MQSLFRRCKVVYLAVSVSRWFWKRSLCHQVPSLPPGRFWYDDKSWNTVLEPDSLKYRREGTRRFHSEITYVLCNCLTYDLKERGDRNFTVPHYDWCTVILKETEWRKGSTSVLLTSDLRNFETQLKVITERRIWNQPLTPSFLRFFRLRRVMCPKLTHRLSLLSLRISRILQQKKRKTCFGFLFFCYFSSWVLCGFIFSL